MAVRMSALRAGHPFTPQEYSWYSFLMVEIEMSGMLVFNSILTWLIAQEDEY
jgi:hypothetical protein